MCNLPARRAPVRVTARPAVLARRPRPRSRAAHCPRRCSRFLTMKSEVSKKLCSSAVSAPVSQSTHAHCETKAHRSTQLARQPSSPLENLAPGTPVMHLQSKNAHTVSAWSSIDNSCPSRVSVSATTPAMLGPCAPPQPQSSRQAHLSQQRSVKVWIDVCIRAFVCSCATAEKIGVNTLRRAGARDDGGLPARGTTGAPSAWRRQSCRRLGTWWRLRCSCVGRPHL